MAVAFDMWHISGPGFDVQDARPEKYRKFILKHAASLRAACKTEMDDYFELFREGCIRNGRAEAPSIDEAREAWNSISASEPVSLIMSYETGIGFDYAPQTDFCEDCVIFRESFPWRYNDKEKSMTFEDLRAIMEQYADELGIEFKKEIDLVYCIT